jgi:isoleucyl-tRNA synthetase
MDLVRAVCSTGLSLRKARQLRVRLPLARLTVGHPAAISLAPYADLIRDEVNVKEVDFTADPARLGTFELAVNPRVLGPRVGAKVQEVIKAVKAGNVTRSGDSVIAAGVELEAGEYDVRLVAADPESTAALPGNTGLVALDTVVTPDLAAEGTARDVVRIVQQARRDAKLVVTDRIRLTVGADGSVADAVRTHMGFIAGETLATELTVLPAADVDAQPQSVGDGGSVKVTVTAA